MKFLRALIDPDDDTLERARQRHPALMCMGTGFILLLGALAVALLDTPTY